MPIVDRPRVVVTGGASGLGRALAKHFGESGARVLVADLVEPGSLETKEIVERAGGEAWTTRCDVSKLADVQALVETAREVMGGVDVMINNAGVAVAGAVGEAPIPDWEWIMGVNLWGVIYGCHVVAPLFKTQGSGHFINIASLAAIAQVPGMGPYNVTKAGVVALTETIFAELRGTGVTATALCPTFFRTNIHKAQRSPEKLRAASAKLVEGSKWSAEQIANVALDGLEKGKLYVVPQNDGKLAWGMKRFLGNQFPKLAAKAAARMKRS